MVYWDGVKICAALIGTETGMKQYKYIFFDLDGTLTDSAPGILNSIGYALDKLGLPVPEREQLNSYIGPPLLDSFTRLYGMGMEQARQGVVYYREYYGDRGLFENSVYEGIPQLLERLGAAGKRLYVATAKPEFYAEQIISHFGLGGYFEFVAGSAMDESRLNKEQVIEYALGRIDGVDPSEVLMVGDRSNDVLGARANGIDCLGVLYGYGDREELASSGALYIANDTVEAGNMILGV